MSKGKRFFFSTCLIVAAAVNSHYGDDFVAIPTAIVAIILLGSVLKEELGI